jgi:hypothetical protein
VAGLVTAVAGLVVALTQAGVLSGDDESAAPAAAPATATPVAAIDGRWRAQVRYPWGVTQDEVFAFRVEDDSVHGSATYLGVSRAIEGGAISGARVTFTTRGEELLGAERRSYENRYDGIVSVRGIQFELRDSRGNPPVEFTARRAP